MSIPWILTCPSSRGIGLGLTAHLLATTRAPIVATARSDLNGTRERILSSLSEHGLTNPSDREDADGRLHVLEVDVTKEETIETAAKKCSQWFPQKSHHLHLSFLTPGILHPEKSPIGIDAVSALETLKINLLAPMLLTKHFLPFLPRKSTSLPSSSPIGLPPTPTISLMSARVGSISDNKLGGWYSYRTSKAGVLQLAKSLDIYLKQRSGEKAICIALHPGTVRTDLSRGFWASEDKGGKANQGEGLFEVERASRQLVDVVRNLNAGKDRGRCFDWRGKEVVP